MQYAGTSSAAPEKQRRNVRSEGSILSEHGSKLTSIVILRTFTCNV